MSRHGYSDDLDQQNLAMWRGRVMSAIRGRRGQKLLRDLVAALDAMPDKRLFAGILATPDGCCALGCVGLSRGIDFAELQKNIDPEYDADECNGILSEKLDIAECLVREIEYENDDFRGTPEKRWAYMRRWAERRITKPTNAESAGVPGAAAPASANSQGGTTAAD